MLVMLPQGPIICNPINQPQDMYADLSRPFWSLNKAFSYPDLEAPTTIVFSEVILSFLPYWEVHVLYMCITEAFGLHC